MADKVRITEDFSNIAKGSVLEVLGENQKTYKVRNTAGIPVFVPKVYAEVVDANAAVTMSVSAQAPPKPSLEMTSEEERYFEELLASANGVLEPVAGAVTPESTFKPPKTKAEKVREMLKPHATPALEENQFWLTDLTEGRLPMSGIDHKITAYPMGTWDDDQSEDIPDVDVNYYWDPDVLETLYLSYSLNMKVLVTGMPGSGKTSGIKQFASHIQQPYMRFNGKDGIEQSSFLGYPWGGKEGMEWRDGLLPQGLKEGYLVCIDEIFKIPPGIMMAIQPLLERNGFLMLDDKPGKLHDKMIWPDSKARLMVTDNVRGTGDNFEKFAATHLQDTSSLDRIDLTIEQHYLPSTQEEIMLLRKFPMADRRQIIEPLVKFAGLVREGYREGNVSLTLSPRGLEACLEVMSEAKLPLGLALKYSFINKLAVETEVQAVNLMIQNCF